MYHRRNILPTVPDPTPPNSRRDGLLPEHPSERIRIALIIDGLRHEALVLGRDYLILRHHAPVPPGPAQVAVTTGGQKERRAPVTVTGQRMTAKGLRVTLEMA